MGWKRSVYSALNRRGGRFVLAIAGTGYASARARRTCRVFYNGAWVHQYPDGVLVEPEIILPTLAEIQESAADQWTYQYAPGPGDIVVDIGAGTGWDTLFFSRRVGPTGKVISIEAHPRTFFCLEEMCKRNRLENVILLNCAVTAGESEVFISDRVTYHSNSIVGNEKCIPVRGSTAVGSVWKTPRALRPMSRLQWLHSAGFQPQIL